MKARARARGLDALSTARAEMRAPRSRPGLCAASVSHAAGLPLGGPRHGEVDDVPAELLASSVLVHDGPRWFGVYERFQPVQLQDTAEGSAEVPVVRE
jgi:hypothetical protein